MQQQFQIHLNFYNIKEFDARKGGSNERKAKTQNSNFNSSQRVWIGHFSEAQEKELINQKQPFIQLKRMMKPEQFYICGTISFNPYVNYPNGQLFFEYFDPKHAGKNAHFANSYNPYLHSQNVFPKWDKETASKIFVYQRIHTQQRIRLADGDKLKIGNYSLLVFKVPDYEKYGKVLNIQVSKNDQRLAGFNVKDIDQNNPFTIGQDASNKLRLYDPNIANKQGFITKEREQSNSPYQFFYQNQSQDGSWLQIQQGEPVPLHKLYALMFHDEINQLVVTTLNIQK